MTQPRRPAGTPAGGQFAPVNHPEASGIELSDDDLVEPVEADTAPTETPAPSQVAAKTTEERLAALEHLTHYGPDYSRVVEISLSDHRHFERLGEHDTAEHYLLLAEMQAGLRTWDEFVELDPFERIARERRAAEVQRAADRRPEPTGPVSQRPARPPAKEVIARLFPDGEPQCKRRRHKLLPQELVEQIPELYETEDTPVEDKLICAHYFTGAADWYICELDRETGEMFGRCDLGLGFPEWGYVRIQDLAMLQNRFGLPVERDLYFKKPKTARELGLVKP